MILGVLQPGLWTGSSFDWNRTRNEIKFYSSEQNQKFEMAINRLIMLFYRSI